MSQPPGTSRMMYSTEPNARAGVGLVVHREEDAGDDLDHQHEQRERAEEVPEVEVLRRVVLGGVHASTPPPTEGMRASNQSHNAVSRPAMAQRPFVSCLRRSAACVSDSTCSGGTCRLSGAGAPLEHAAGVVELRAVAGAVEAAGPVAAHLRLGLGASSAAASSRGGCTRLPSPSHSGLLRARARSSRSPAASKRASSGSVSRAFDRLQRLDHFLGAADHPHRLAAPLDDLPSRPARCAEMSTSTGAPAAFARSEGHMLTTKGTAAPTLAAPPTTEVATTRLRRVLSTFVSSFMEMALLWD